MKNNIALKTTLLISALLLTGSLAMASEITGTLSSSPSQPATSTISGTVSGGSNQTTVVSGSGGGGGGFVIPGAAYSYSNSGGVSTGLQPLTPQVLGASTENFTGVGGADYINITYRNLGRLAQSTTIATTTTATDTATITTPVIEQPIVTPAEDASSTTGPFDFFGISVWFWLVLAVLALLIIAILYMQSL
jgi:hypothetical protein